MIKYIEKVMSLEITWTVKLSYVKEYYNIFVNS